LKFWDIIKYIICITKQITKSNFIKIKTDNKISYTKYQILKLEKLI